MRKTLRLGDFVENPDNPQRVTDDAFVRLVEKMRRVPEGLTAKRIAFVTDHPAGKYVVMSGNKRLRALKIIHGENGRVPAEWFQDITKMSEAERNEFIIDANVVEGRFDADKLLKLYSTDDLEKWIGADGLADIVAAAERATAAAVAAAPGSGSEPGAGGADGETAPAALEEFEIKLTIDDYNEAVAHLRKVNSDMNKAFEETVCGAERA